MVFKVVVVVVVVVVIIIIIIVIIIICLGQGSVVSIATRYGVDGLGIESQWK